jgi:hypothetical protein
MGLVNGMVNGMGGGDWDFGGWFFLFCHSYWINYQQ